jgi:hypothetical protein
VSFDEDTDSVCVKVVGVKVVGVIVVCVKVVCVKVVGKAIGGVVKDSGQTQIPPQGPIDYEKTNLTVKKIIGDYQLNKYADEND